MLTPAQTELVQQSWRKVAQDPDRIAGLFYERLFELDPTARRLFEKTSMLEQGRKITQMVTVVVGDLGALQSLGPAMRALGSRHVEYGVTEAQYDSVANALYWALEQVLGDEFTPETRQAWATTYELMAGSMKAGARAKP